MTPVVPWWASSVFVSSIHLPINLPVVVIYSVVIYSIVYSALHRLQILVTGVGYWPVGD